VAGDGQEVQIVCVTERHWHRLCAAIGHPEWTDDPLCANNAARLANRQVVRSRLEPVIASDSAASWVKRISDHGALCEHVRDIEEAWADERLLARGLVSGRTESGPGWAARMPVVSLARTESGPANGLAPAPALGADTDEVVRALAAGRGASAPSG
jgi:crotonobetainyl-CoA:carnitine CoA-transferase CaiB-like acyl-CoA transferase